MSLASVLGVDVGGTHITVAIVDLTIGELRDESLARSSVDSLGTKEEILESWCTIIRQTQLASSSKSKIGIAMPGPFDYENGISLIKDQHKFRSLYLTNIKVELANGLGIPETNIRFINDAAAFLQGEIFCGAAKGFDQALGITLGTGLGAAIAINGRASDAALWDANFRDGIAEDYLSTRWFIARYKELTGEEVEGVKELAAVAKTNQMAQQVFNEFGIALGDFLTAVINKNKSEVVVLGGNISQAFELFEESLKQQLSLAKLNTQIKLSELNENATLVGAATCWDKVLKVVNS
ncbi:MAG: ROK family protein [Chitinophagaceae bacterium]|nr:MAG: ROK family protein [Chitinophagaceae bacterium]